MTIVALFLVPVILISLKTEDAVQSFVQAEAEQFVDESRAAGYISPENYLTFVNSIGRAGTFEVELEHRSETAYPVTEDEAGNPADGHAYRTGYKSYYREEILDEMFGGGSDEPYLMKNGDYLTVTVKGTGSSITNAFTRMFLGSGSGGTMAVYGGMVGATGGLT